MWCCWARAAPPGARSGRRRLGQRDDRPGRPSIPLATSFLGFSTEYWGLPIDARHLSLFARLVSLVRVPGDPRFVLRIGGNSSDHSFWEPAQRRWPRWMFPLTPRWIRAAADIARASHLRVIFDLTW